VHPLETRGQDGEEVAADQVLTGKDHQLTVVMSEVALVNQAHPRIYRDDTSIHHL
jgi:hypothetical protein